MILLDNVVVSFDSYQALNHVSLKIEDNEGVIGLIGPNGAGKTTLMRSIFGQQSLHSGQLVLNHHEIAYCTDMPSFEPYLTAYEILEQSLLLYSKPVLAENIFQLLDFVGLNHVGKKYVSTFSRGMKQRLGIAAVLILDPKIVFLDEPTSALDPFGREDIIALIKKIAKKRTVVVSSHLLNDMQVIANRLLVLNKGHLLFDGRLQEFLDEVNDMSDILLHDKADSEQIIMYLTDMGMVVTQDDTDERLLHIPKSSFETVFQLLASQSEKIQSFNQETLDLTRVFIDYVSREDREV